MDMAGPVLSTVKVPLGPAAGAVLPAPSLAVPASMLMLRVPLPVIPLIVTVGVAVVPPVTATVPAAVPVGLFNVISPASKLIVLAPV